MFNTADNLINNSNSISNNQTNFNPYDSNKHIQILIHLAEFRIFALISIHFVKIRIFILISIRFINFQLNISISIYITRKLPYKDTHHQRIAIQGNSVVDFLHITPLILTTQKCVLGCRIYYCENRISISGNTKLLLISFLSSGLEALFSVNDGTAICRIRISTAF